MTVNIHHADILEFIKNVPDNHYHVIFADPPYHLGQITKRYGGKNAAPAQHGRDGAYSRLSAGFMNQDWDGGDIAFNPETWHALMRVLKPGGFMVMYAGSKGFYRMACAMEDAGLVLHQSIFAWVNGQGFPKPAPPLHTAIDRRLGKVQPVVARRRHSPKFAAKDFGYRKKDNGFNSSDRQDFEIKAPVSDMAKMWSGYRYGIATLAPMVEPIVIAQKPFEGDAINTIMTTGAGAYNIDATRIKRSEAIKINRYHDYRVTWGFYVDESQNAETDERYTAVESDEGYTKTFVLMHHPECTTGGCIYGCAVQAFDTQSGGRSEFYQDVGWAYEIYERINNANRAHYVAKPNRDEKEIGLDGMPVARLNDGRKKVSNNARLRGTTDRLNPHPTVKPIDMSIYLAKLFLPPAQYNPAVLNPFAGSGTESISLYLAGWQHIDAVELTAKYIPVIHRRVEFWQKEHEAGLVDSAVQHLRDQRLMARKEREQQDRITKNQKKLAQNQHDLFSLLGE